MAAPAAGTQLAGKRLDQFLNVTLTLLGKVIDAGSGWFDFVKAIAVQLVSARTNAAACPGLEAMMPDSSFVRFLNIAEPLGDDSEEQLAIVSGDVSGGRWYEILKQVFVDFYFRRRKNDFVVDTASMTRGAQRRHGFQFRYEGPNADHFSYFQSRQIRERAVAFLTSGDVTGFEPLERGSEAIPSRFLDDYKYFTAAEVVARPRRPELATVVILPGIMGTRLGLDPEPVLWVNLGQMAFGGIQKLLYQQGDAIKLYGLIEAFYGRLAVELDKHYNVSLIGFDWRASIKDSAAVLADALAPLLNEQAAPIHLLAHSMGGLVARGLITWHKEVWDKLTARGGKLVMLGTPNFGSYAPAQAFTKQHPLVQTLSILDQDSSVDEVAEVIRGFPGLVEMLPPKGPRGRRPRNRPPGRGGMEPNPNRPTKALLDKAREIREQLDEIPPEEKQHMVYVAGYNRKTPVAARLSRDDASYFDNGKGDGTVPWSLGLIPGVKTFYALAEHGDLPRDVKSFSGYLDLLKSGYTTQLGTMPTVRSTRLRDGTPDTDATLTPSEAALVLPSHFPSEEDVVAAAMGSGGAGNQSSSEYRCSSRPRTRTFTTPSTRLSSVTTKGIRSLVSKKCSIAG